MTDTPTLVMISQKWCEICNVPGVNQNDCQAVGIRLSEVYPLQTKLF